MDVADGSVWVSNLSMLTKYSKSPEPRDDSTIEYERTAFDGVYVPRKVHITGDIDVHDIVVYNGVPHFISAVYSCVCVPSETSSMRVYWKPDWVSKIAAEDRTHLNGLCSDERGRPCYVTACARTDVRGGWREHRKSGGVVWDIIQNKLVCGGDGSLSMPHSPRLHAGKLWLLNSGHGEFGYVDFTQSVPHGEGGRAHHPFVACCFVPGYLRGLTFIGTRYAVVGTSDDRHERVFSGLELGTRLRDKGVAARCGLHVIDLHTFDVVHEMTFHKPINELYDVVALPNVRRPVLEELNVAGLAVQLSVEPPTAPPTPPPALPTAPLAPPV